MTIHVRHGVREDADTLARAHIDAWRVAYRGVIPDEYLDSPEFESERTTMWQGWTWPNQPGAQLFVPEVDGRVVGFGLVGPERGDHAGAHTRRGEVYAFYLHPTAWGSGAASATMARCTEFLRDAGFTEAVLWVLRDNPRARRFYEKSGWRVTGEETSWDGPSTAAKLPVPVTETQYGISLS